MWILIVGITLINAIRVFLDTSGESIRWWLIGSCYRQNSLVRYGFYSRAYRNTKGIGVARFCM